MVWSLKRGLASPVMGMADQIIEAWLGLEGSLLLPPKSDVMVRVFASSSGSWDAAAGSIFIFNQFLFHLVGDLILGPGFAFGISGTVSFQAGIWRSAAGVLVLKPAPL